MSDRGPYDVSAVGGVRFVGLSLVLATLWPKRAAKSCPPAEAPFHVIETNDYARVLLVGQFHPTVESVGFDVLPGHVEGQSSRDAARQGRRIFNRK